LAAVAAVLVVLLLVGVGVGKLTPDWKARPVRPPQTSAPAPDSVSGGGFTLTSTAIELPEDPTTFQGEGGDMMIANCTACHSAGMVQIQPRLTEAQWKAVVQKMREVYHAPIAEESVPAIVAYLTRVSTGLPGVAPP
jgi:mono/diheme cytochrome c family protein